MDIIKSKDNKTVKYISKLISSAKFRKSEHKFVIEGTRLCLDAIKSSAQIDTLMYSESANDKYSDIISRLSEQTSKTFCCDDRIFCALSDTKTPQGVLCVVKTLDKKSNFDTIKNNGIIVALDNIQDPQNLGTILRSADAFGIGGVVLSEGCCDLYSPKVVRGSMGAIFRLPVIECDLVAFINEFSGNTYACVLDESAVTVNEAVFDKPSLAVIGNEGNGVSEAVIKACKSKLYIPMNGDAESLNASVAASIIMWEMIK